MESVKLAFQRREKVVYAFSYERTTKYGSGETALFRDLS